MLTAFTSYTMMWVNVYCSGRKDDSISCVPGEAFDEEVRAGAHDVADDIEDLSRISLYPMATLRSTDDFDVDLAVKAERDVDFPASPLHSMTTVDHRAASITRQGRTLHCCCIDFKVCCDCVATDPLP